MMHLSELDNTLFLTNKSILQKKETFYSVAAIRVVNIGTKIIFTEHAPEAAAGYIIVINH